MAVARKPRIRYFADKLVHTLQDIIDFELGNAVERYDLSDKTFVLQCVADHFSEPIAVRVYEEMTGTTDSESEGSDEVECAGKRQDVAAAAKAKAETRGRKRKINKAPPTPSRRVGAAEAKPPKAAGKHKKLGAARDAARDVDVASKQTQTRSRTPSPTTPAASAGPSSRNVSSPPKPSFAEPLPPPPKKVRQAPASRAGERASTPQPRSTTDASDAREHRKSDNRPDSECGDADRNDSLDVFRSMVKPSRTRQEIMDVLFDDGVDETD